MIHSTFLMLSGGDMLVIALLVLLLFGGKKIPEFAKGLGKGIKEFKDSQSGDNPEKKV